MLIEIEDAALRGLELTQAQALLDLAVGVFTERRGTLGRAGRKYTDDAGGALNGTRHCAAFPSAMTSRISVQTCARSLRCGAQN